MNSKSSEAILMIVVIFIIMLCIGLCSKSESKCITLPGPWAGKC